MMAMIKVGQIYKITRHRFGHINNIIAITRISDRRVDAIRTDGAAYKKSLDDLLYGKCYLIAEYPTWQEAVNSEYFKNDD